MGSRTSKSEQKYSDAFFKDILREVIPERATEIDELLVRHGITIRADATEYRPKFFVDPNTHEITVSTSWIPRIYGHAYAYLSLYEVIEKAKAENHHIRKVTTADEGFARAMAVLEWAMKRDAIAKPADDATAPGLQDYPSDVPLPFDPDSNDPRHRVACDVALMTLGLILLHEIAHIELDHNLVRGPDSLTQEYEADARAAAFFLDKCDVYGEEYGHSLAEVRRKRVLALVIGELWLLHFEVHFGVTTSESHPPTYDRLSNLVGQQAEDGTDVAWAMAATVLCLHYQARYGIPHGDAVFKDFRECYQYYANLLSNKPRLDF